MKQIYICPAIKLNEAQAALMIADSLKLNSDKEVDAGGALTKEDNAWDIWSDDAE